MGLFKSPSLWFFYQLSKKKNSDEIIQKVLILHCYIVKKSKWFKLTDFNYKILNNSYVLRHGLWGERVQIVQISIS